MAPSASKPLSAGSAASSHKGERGLLSIIICTKDRPAELARAIAAIRASGLVGQQAEIVVVEEAEVPRDIPGVRYVPVPQTGRGFGYARNIGVEASRGELIVFIDDDCEATQGWGEALLEPFLNNPQVLGTAGAVLIKDAGAIGYAEGILGFPGGGLRYLDAAHGQVVPTRFLSTCNCAYRRSALLQAGGFSDEARLGGEDFLLAERVSALGPCVYVPNAVVYHQRRGSIVSVCKWFVRRGRSEIRMFYLTRDRAQFTRFLLRSSWTLRALIMGAFLVRWPALIQLLPGMALLYGGAILWRFRFALKYPGYRQGWWIVPLVKATMDWGAEVGRWKGLISLGRA